MRARVPDGARSVSSLTCAVCSMRPAGPFAHCSIFAPADIYKDPECDVTGWLQRKHSPSEMFYIPPPCFPLPDTHTHISTHESFPSFFPSPSSLSSRVVPWVYTASHELRGEKYITLAVYKSDSSRGFCANGADLSWWYVILLLFLQAAASLHDQLQKVADLRIKGPV